MADESLRERVLRALPEGSVGRYDLLPLFMDAALVGDIAAHLASPYRGKVDAVAAPEALGWLAGSGPREGA